MNEVYKTQLEKPLFSVWLWSAGPSLRAPSQSFPAGYVMKRPSLLSLPPFTSSQVSEPLHQAFPVLDPVFERRHWWLKWEPPHTVLVTGPTAEPW